MPYETIAKAAIAGILASLACGLGVLPLFIRGIDPARHKGLGYAVAGGLMFSASVYNLILPGLRMQSTSWELYAILPVLGGILLGAFFLSWTDRYLAHGSARDTDASMFQSWGGRVGLLVFLAMTVHSIPEGVAVGTGYTADEYDVLNGTIGPTLALAIAIHNIPEGLAVALPLRSSGVGFWRCFWAAVVTSLPQPVAAVPAVILAWLFQPLMPILMGFAAGAMIFLVLLELIPQALNEESPSRMAWAFVFGFCLMLLIQVAI